MNSCGPNINSNSRKTDKEDENLSEDKDNIITAHFINVRTLNFKAQPTNAFFATVNQMFRGSFQLQNTAKCAVINSLSTVQTTKHSARKKRDKKIFHSSIGHLANLLARAKVGWSFAWSVCLSVCRPSICQSVSQSVS